MSYFVNRYFMDCVQIDVPRGEITKSAQIQLVERAKLMHQMRQCVKVFTAVIAGNQQRRSACGNGLPASQERLLLGTLYVKFDIIAALTIQQGIHRARLHLLDLCCARLQNGRRVLRSACIAVTRGIKAEYGILAPCSALQRNDRKAFFIFCIGAQLAVVARIGLQCVKRFECGGIGG